MGATARNGNFVGQIMKENNEDLQGKICADLYVDMYSYVNILLTYEN